MPQVYMIIAPRVREAVSGDLGEANLRQIGQHLINLTEKVYGLEGKDDVTFTAVRAACVIGDADIQVEVRYTAGKDEYGEGKIFEPSEEQMALLVDTLIGALRSTFASVAASVSVWVMPFKGTTFLFFQ